MLRVLTYHRIARPEDSRDLDPRIISATPDAFERQLQYLAGHCVVVSMQDVLEAVRGGKALPARAVLITFDDGYRDLLERAIPALERMRLPATVFVPTAFPDRPERAFWCDRLYRVFTRTARSELRGYGLAALPLGDPAERVRSLRILQHRLKSMDHAEASTLVDRITEQLGSDGYHEPTVMSWDELRDIAERGISVCAHSRSHAILTRVRGDAMRAEIAGSLQDLERELGRVLPVFCYPDGGHDEEVVAAAREAGVHAGFTTLDGHNRFPAADPLRLHRTNITPRTTHLLLRLRLTRWGALVDRLRHGGRAA